MPSALLVVVLVGLPGAAWTAGVAVPSTAVGRTTGSPMTSTATFSANVGSLLTSWTAMDVVVSPAFASTATPQVRIRAEQGGTLHPWTSCVLHAAPSTWRCTYATALLGASGTPTLAAHAAVP